MFFCCLLSTKVSRFAHSQIPLRLFVIHVCSPKVCSSSSFLACVSLTPPLLIGRSMTQRESLNLALPVAFVRQVYLTFRFIVRSRCLFQEIAFITPTHVTSHDMCVCMADSYVTRLTYFADIVLVLYNNYYMYIMFCSYIKVDIIR